MEILPLKLKVKNSVKKTKTRVRIDDLDQNNIDESNEPKHMGPFQEYLDRKRYSRGTKIPSWKRSIQERNRRLESLKDEYETIRKEKKS